MRTMRQEELQLTGGGKKENRRKLDFYPTPKNVTIALMNFLQLPPSCTIWEPACGNLAMSNVIETYGHTVISTDIINGVDFLCANPMLCDAIITNPPFETSALFIEKAIQTPNVNLVAMLLKSQYWHASKRIKLFEKYPPAFVLPLSWRPDFLEHERKIGDKKGAPTMEVAWTVWEKECQHETIYKPLLKP